MGMGHKAGFQGDSEAGAKVCWGGWCKSMESLIFSVKRTWNLIPKSVGATLNTTERRCCEGK